MVDLVLIETVSYIAGALGVFVAAVFYVLNLRISQRNQELALKAQQQTLETRQAQLFQSIYSRFSTKEVLSDLTTIMTWEWRDYDDFMSKYGPGNPEAYLSFWELANFFEGLGIYLKRGFFDVSIIDDFLSGPIRIFWEKVRPVTIEHRRREAWPSYFEWVEYLYNEVHPVTIGQHPDTRPAPQ